MEATPAPSASSTSVAAAMTGEQIMAEDVFTRNVRKVFETLEQIFDARQAVEKKTGPVKSPTYLSFCKYRDHFSQKVDHNIHVTLFSKLYQENKIPILNGIDSWLTVSEAPAILHISPAKKTKGRNGEMKKKPAVEINLTNFYLTTNSVPGDLCKKLRENMIESLVRTFYSLFISKITIAKAGEETPEQLEQKRERDILIKLCRPTAPVSKATGKGMNPLEMLSGYIRKDDIMKAVQTGDTHSLVKNVATTVESLANGIGMPGIKIGDQAVETIANRASMFMDGFKKEGENDILGMTLKSFGDINMRDLIPDGAAPPAPGEEKKAAMTLNGILDQISSNSPALAAVVKQDVSAEQRSAALNNLLGGMGIQLPNMAAPASKETEVAVSTEPPKAPSTTPGDGSVKAE